MFVTQYNSNLEDLSFVLVMLSQALSAGYILDYISAKNR